MGRRHWTPGNVRASQPCLVSFDSLHARELSVPTSNLQVPGCADAKGMTIACPYRHISYSKWRLNVFQTLFQSPSQHPGGTTLPNHDCTSRTIRRSKYGTSSHAARTKDTLGVKESTAPEPPTLGIRDRALVTPTEFDPHSLKGREAIKGLLTELRYTAAKLRSPHKSLDPRISKQSDAVDAPAPEELLRPRNLIEQVRDRDRKRRDQRELQRHGVAVDSLAPSKNTAVKSKSPVLRRLEANLELRTEEKTQPIHHNITGLKNNPWAESLASPIRACQGSGARLPKDFLLDFGFVNNVADGKTYMMPANLADLDSLESEMTARPELDSAFERTTNRRPVTQKARLLSNVTFIQFLSDTLTKPLRAPLHESNPTPVRTSFSNEVSKLVHFEARQAIHKSQRYLDNKRRFEAAKDGMSKAAAQGTAEQETREGFNLSKLQWQFDVPSRVAHIMRRRILVALKALADVETAAKTQGILRGLSGISALPFPANRVIDDEEQMLPAGAEAPGKATAAKPAPAYEHDESQYQRLGHHEWLPGSAFLHVGSKPIADILSSLPSNEESSFPPLPDNNSLIPPMLPVIETYRFPVFSLHRLFSHPWAATNSNDLDELRSLLTNPIFHCAQSVEQGQSDYLLFVRPLQGPGRTVIEEVWRLWRYLGGENMGVDFSETDPDELIKRDWASRDVNKKFGRLGSSGQTLDEALRQKAGVSED